MREAVTLKRLALRLSPESYDFISLGIKEFATNFKHKAPSPIDRSSCRFMKLHENIWVYAVKHHISFSDMKISNIVSWGISPQKEPYTVLKHHHGDVYLALCT